MKNTLLIGIAISGLVFSTTSTQAQVSDNDSSGAVLAAYCAQSSGLPASNYESYCRELARVIGQLPAVAQHRVFEDKMPYVPNSGGYGDARDASDQARANASSDSAVGQTVEGSNNGSTEPTQENTSQSNAGNRQSSSNGGSVKSSKSGGLQDILDTINDFLFGK